MAKKRYEVWALGYDKDWCATDVEKFLAEFPINEKNKAIEFADKLTLDQMFHDYELNDGDIISVRVETVVDKEDYTENIDVVYEKTLEYTEGCIMRALTDGVV